MARKDRADKKTVDQILFGKPSEFDKKIDGLMLTTQDIVALFPTSSEVEIDRVLFYIKRSCREQVKRLADLGYGKMVKKSLPPTEYGRINYEVFEPIKEVT